MTGIETAIFGTLHSPSMKTYPTSQTHSFPLKYEFSGQSFETTATVGVFG